MEERKKDWKFRTLLISGFGIFIYMVISIMNVIGSFFSPTNAFWFDPGKGTLIFLMVFAIYMFFVIKYIIHIVKKHKRD